MSGFPRVSLSWGEGRFFDYWMVAHLVGGVPFGFLALYLGYGRWSYGAAAGIFVAWEIFEMLTKTPESWENRAIDVLIALAGFAFAYELFGDSRHVAWLTMGAAAIAIALNIAGWYFRGLR
jgi:hypothetical protein